MDGWPRSYPSTPLPHYKVTFLRYILCIGGRYYVDGYQLPSSIYNII